MLYVGLMKYGQRNPVMLIGKNVVRWLIGLRSTKTEPLRFRPQTLSMRSCFEWSKAISVARTLFRSLAQHPKYRKFSLENGAYLRR